MVDRVGQQLGNYQITKLLGRGGFAEVYLGEHKYLKTQAAVKVLQARLSNQEDLDGFLKEAKTVARLIHPHIVRVLDFGVDDEAPFLVMDYAPQGTLRQRHKRGERLPLESVTQYIKQIAEALQYAHDEKLIHRDIKPENMLVDRRGDILLSDFGIALVVQSSRYQSTQNVIGTVAYMSPEQIQGHPRPASDQYSLGIIAYEWLSGERPFNGSFTELCTQHMFASLPSLRARVPEISPDVEMVVSTALAKDPKQRFGSVQAFAKALEQASTSSFRQETPSNAATSLSSSPLPPTEPARRPEAPPVLTPAEQTPISTSPAAVPPMQPVATLSSVGNISPHLSTPDNPPLPKPSSSPQRRSLWRVDRGQLIAMGIGIVLLTLIKVGIDYIFFHSDPIHSIFFQNIAGQLFLPSLFGLLVGACYGFPLFFGARFGPLVGFGVVLCGFIAGDLIAGIPAGSMLNTWYTSGFLSLLGFLPGLLFGRTQGHYNTRSAIGRLLLVCVIALIAQLVPTYIDFSLSPLGNLNNIDYLNYFYLFLEQFLGEAPSLPLLLLALFVSEKLTQASSRNTDIA